MHTGSRYLGRREREAWAGILKDSISRKGGREHILTQVFREWRKGAELLRSHCIGQTNRGNLPV
jgi:hypothetical protein